MHVPPVGESHARSGAQSEPSAWAVLRNRFERALHPLMIAVILEVIERAALDGEPGERVACKHPSLDGPVDVAQATKMSTVVALLAWLDHISAHRHPNFQ